MTGRARLGLCVLLAVTGCHQPPSKDAPDPQGVASIAATPAEAAIADVATPLVSSSGSSGAAQPPQVLSQQPPMRVPTARNGKPRRVGVYTPSPGSPERVALLNALRDAVRGDMGGDPIFVVRDLRSNGDWAFGVMEPTWEGGRPITPEQTPLYQRTRDRDGLDGLRTEAIWRREGARWRVVAHSIGATDVWWTGYCAGLPFGLLPGCRHG